MAVPYQRAVASRSPSGHAISAPHLWRPAGGPDCIEPCKQVGQDGPEQSRCSTRRRMRGFETAAQASGATVRVAGESRVSVARLLTHWDDSGRPRDRRHAAGQDQPMARVSGATLTLLVPAPAPMIEMQPPHPRQGERLLRLQCGGADRSDPDRALWPVAEGRRPLLPAAAPPIPPDPAKVPGRDIARASTIQRCRPRCGSWR